VIYSSTPSRRSQHHANRQSSGHHSSTSSHNIQIGEQISCAHPDYHIGAFLDDDMRPTKLDALLALPEPSQKVMEENSWNPDDRSLNIYVKEEDRLTLHRHPVAQSTDCIRGRVGHSKGFHVWQIVWPLRQRGTHAVIGVATKDAPLHSPGYSSLVGSTADSYGWDLSEYSISYSNYYISVRNVCLHDSKNTKSWTCKLDRTCRK
jgi:SPRY domain-containing SOCS box protein 1/4